MSAIAFTCFGCGKKLVKEDELRGQPIECPTCAERFAILEDEHPERMVEVWFSRQKQDDSTIDRVIRFIGRAKSTLDIAMYSLTHDWLRLPFEYAHKRGVKMRIITDKTQAGGEQSDDEEYARMGIQVALDVRSGKMHHKFVIRDGKTVLTGSYNWTKSAEGSNQENFVILHYPHVVKQFQAEFDRLWSDNKEGIITKAELEKSRN